MGFTNHFKQKKLLFITCLLVVSLFSLFFRSIARFDQLLLITPVGSACFSSSGGIAHVVLTTENLNEQHINGGLYREDPRTLRYTTWAYTKRGQQFFPGIDTESQRSWHLETGPWYLLPRMRTDDVFDVAYDLDSLSVTPIADSFVAQVAYWHLLLIALASYTGFWFLRANSDAKRRRALGCRVCGYSLIGLDTDSGIVTCPECGSTQSISR